MDGALNHVHEAWPALFPTCRLASRPDSALIFEPDFTLFMCVCARFSEKIMSWYQQLQWVTGHWLWGGGRVGGCERPRKLTALFHSGCTRAAKRHWFERTFIVFCQRLYLPIANKVAFLIIWIRIFPNVTQSFQTLVGQNSQIIRVISKYRVAAEYGHMSSAMCVCEPRVDCARFSSPSVGFAIVSCSGDSLWPCPCVRQRPVMWSLPMRCVLNWYFYFCFKRWNLCVWHDPDRLGQWKAKCVCSFWISILFYSFGHVH